GAVAVSVADGRVLGVERLVVDHARFHHLEVDLSGAPSEREAVAAIEEALAPLSEAAAERLVAVRVRLHGETPATIASRPTARGSPPRSRPPRTASTRTSGWSA
ncbi:hypothetical protein PSTG_19979, partial [Puccinia striiformis f. sp. tritici PST-78]